MKVGEQVPNFAVSSDKSGETINLIPPGKKAAVVLFIASKCPICKAYMDRIATLAKDSAYKDVAFLAVDPDQDASDADRAALLAKMNELNIPLVRDPRKELTRHFGATTTPSVWVIDAKSVTAYYGAIDDNVDASAVKNSYLKEALDAALAGKPAPRTETKPFGTTIRRRRR